MPKNTGNGSQGASSNPMKNQFGTFDRFPGWRRLHAVTLALSVVLHLGIYGLMGWITAIESGKISVSIRLSEPTPPLTTMFRVAPPPSQKAMTLRKKPLPAKKPMVRRQSLAERPRASFERVSEFRSSNLDQYSSGSFRARAGAVGPVVGSGVEIGEESPAVETGPAVTASLKEPEKRISMQEEFLDLKDLDTGKYKGLVIQDPNDKRSIKGFIYLAQAIASEIDPPTPRAIPQLAEAVNSYTQINAQVEKRLPLDSRELFKAPFVYISEKKGFSLTEHEAQNLGDYLKSGGFILVDNAAPLTEFGPGEASLRKMLKDALGKDARFRLIPRDHPIYHCFFDFADGPPPGGEVSGGDGDRGPTVSDLEGIFLDDRLVVVYADKGYGSIWEQDFQNEPQLKMGVNLVVFALTQQGSIAQQQIDFYSQRK